MFETLFTYPKVLARHLEAPAAAERARYLMHCASEGMAHATLIGRANELLVVAERLDVTAGKSFTQREIETAAEKWVRHQRRRGRIENGYWSRQWFIQIATAWLGFVGRLELPDRAHSIFQCQIDDFLACSGDDHGLAPPTISGRRWQVETFLRSLAPSKASIGSITVRDVDAYLDRKGREGWCRVSVATCAAALRSFFQHAEMRGWCVGGIAAAIDSPRLFKQEGLPRGPRWDDVLKLMESSTGDDPRDIRDHAILMLLAIYGLRSGEVRNLRLDDLDWTSEIITVERSKQRRIQYYPLVASVGDAILRYGAGLRVREALALTWDDVDLASDILCIRESKFYKTRLVPISEDLTRILTSHSARHRNEHGAPDTPFLLSRIGKAITIQNAELAFCRLRVRAGVVCENADSRHQPRLHDLRHSFAVHRLVAWYQSGADVQRLLPKLATYLGHVHICGTQRYLTLTPELLREASVRFERYAMEKDHG